MRYRLNMTPTGDDYHYLLDNLRPEDAFELECSGLSKSDVIGMCGASIGQTLVERNGVPVFAYGVVDSGKVGFVWGFGTREARRAIPLITCDVRESYFPYFLFGDGGFERVEVAVPRKSVHSIKWLKSLGAKEYPAGPAHNGEPMVRLVYTQEDYVRDVLLRSASPSSPSPARLGHTSQNQC